MATLLSPEDFQAREDLDDQFWEILKPHFENGQQPFPNWFGALNYSGKSLLVMAAEMARCEEMEIFLKLIRQNKNTVPPGGTRATNIMWIAIANIGTPRGDSFLECLLHFPDFVRQHAFAVIDEERGQSPVHLAALRGTVNLFKTLKGCDESGLIERLKRCVDRDGETPLDLAIHNGELEMIKLLMELYKLPASTDKLGRPKENLLHRALKAKTPNLAVIQIILRKNSFYLTEPNREGKTPLQYISGKQDPNLLRIASDESKEAVRLTKNFLVSCLFESNVTYEDLRKELGNEALGKELYFNVSFMNQPIQSFENYLEDLEDKDIEIEFHNTLKYVSLPDLQCSEYEGTLTDTLSGQLGPRNPCNGKYGVRSTYEALKVFEYLRQRKVKQVKSVKVLDCLIHPHPNLKIKECLGGLDVRTLDWRKRDLSLSLVKNVAPNVAELHLYSSGNEDVLHFWEQVGLPGLTEMQKLYITISRHEFDPSNTEGIESFREKWEALFRQRVPKCSVIMEPLPEPTSDPVIDGLHRTLSKSAIGKTMFTEMEKVLEFIKDISSDDGQTNPRNRSARANPIKVAILDTGLSLFELPGKPDQVVGRSFVEDSSPSDTHWHSPQCSHGSKLAQLILRCNPDCKLYIAKVQSGPDATSVEIGPAIRALEWVAKEKVDIICMSWTINESTMEQDQRYEFEDAIEKAAALTFCSLSDEGRIHNPGTSYPAGFKKSFKISSYSPLHRESNDSEHHPEAFYFPADDLEVLAIPKYFSDATQGSTDVFRGSSYATALAAGTAAFVLQCVQHAFHPGTEQPVLPGGRIEQPKAVKDMILAYKRVKMERLFLSMCDQGEAKHFVKPWMAFSRDWSLSNESEDKLLGFLKASLERG